MSVFTPRHINNKIKKRNARRGFCKSYKGFILSGFQSEPDWTLFGLVSDLSMEVYWASLNVRPRP